MRKRKLKIAEFVESLDTPQKEIIVFGGSQNSINGTNESKCSNSGGACATSINKADCINYGIVCDKNTNWVRCMEMDPVTPNFPPTCSPTVNTCL